MLFTIYCPPARDCGPTRPKPQNIQLFSLLNTVCSIYTFQYLYLSYFAHYILTVTQHNRENSSHMKTLPTHLFVILILTRLNPGVFQTNEKLKVLFSGANGNEQIHINHFTMYSECTVGQQTSSVQCSEKADDKAFLNALQG